MTEIQMPDLKAAADASAMYREACAASVVPGRTNLLQMYIGHGTYLACAMAAERCGAARVLMILSPASMETAAEQLSREGYAVRKAGTKRGSAGEACRQAAARQGNRMTVFMMTPRQAAEAGHWHEANTGSRPFDMAVIADAEQFTNLRSERGRGMATVSGRAGTTLLVCSREYVDERQTARILDAWNAEPCQVRMPVRCAAGACEAACMDAD